MEKTELIAVEIISSVGTARSMYIEAIQEAKQGSFEKAKELIQEGAEMFLQGHHSHAKLLQMEANQEKTDISLLLMHAEDQLMSAEGFKIISEEFISLYELINKK